MAIQGAKAGNRKPVRESVSAISRQTMSILYGITEGEALMFGKNPTQSEIKQRIFLDGTPIVSSTGETLLDVEVDYRTGTVTQTPIAGVKSATITDNIGVEVKHNSPVARTYTNPDVHTYEVMINIAQLFDGDADGNSRKGTIEFSIEASVNGGPFTVKHTEQVTEKVINGYTPIYSITIPEDGTHTIRVSKITADTESEYAANSLYLVSIAQIFEANLAYPTTALLWLRFNAEQFRNVPKLELRFFGKSDLLIPTNYDTTTREYRTSGAGTTNGIWDGTFIRGYTDNPAWIWLDLLVTKRYGLGHRVSIDMINKWELYKVAKWCDELVPDGKGGTEPRITCNNLYLNTNEDAFRILSDLATIFRASTVFDGSHIFPKADMPRDIVHTFALSSLVDVQYSSVAASAIHNVCHCTYFDKNNNFTKTTVTRSRRQDIAQTGRVEPLDLPTLGCTTVGQAQRAAEYALLSEATETRLVAITCSLDGSGVKVGDLFVLHDSFMDGRLSSGRVRSVTANIILIDRDIDFTVSSGATVTVNSYEGVITLYVLSITGRELSLSTIDGSYEGASAAAELLSRALTHTVWVLRDSNSTDTSIYTTLETKFDEADNTWTISGVAYNANKNSIVDNAALSYDSAPTSSQPNILSPPVTVAANYRVYTDQGVSKNDIDVSWSYVSGASFYELEQQDEVSNWRVIAKTPDVNYSIRGVAVGNYEFRVRAIDSFGVKSNYAAPYPINVAGKTIPPDTVTGVVLTGRSSDVIVNWDFAVNSDDVVATLIDYTDNTESGVIDKIRVAFPTDTATFPIKSGAAKMYARLAVVDSTGLVSAYTSWFEATPSADDILTSITGKIGKPQLTTTLYNEITNRVVVAATSISAMVDEQTSRIFSFTATGASGNSPTGKDFTGIILWAGLGAGSDKGMQIAIGADGSMRVRQVTISTATPTAWVDGTLAGISTKSIKVLKSDGTLATEITGADGTIHFSSMPQYLTNANATAAGYVAGDMFVITDSRNTRIL